MVSATDTPYQPFPTGRTSPQAPSDYQQIPTSPQMFGSIEAEALQRAGQEGEKLATSVAQIGAYEQRMEDMSEADKLLSQRDNERHKEFYGDPTAGIDPVTGRPVSPGLKNMIGQEAVDYIKSGAPGKSFDDSVNRIAASASNERVRQMFLHQSRAQRAAFDTAVGEHWNSQVAAQYKESTLARNGVNNRDLAAAYNDDARIATLVNDKIALYTRDKTDPRVLADAYYSAVHDGAKELIDAALADDKPQRAKQLFDAYKDHMNGGDQLKLWRSIEGPWNKAVEHAMAAGRGAGGGNPIAAADHYNQAIALGASPNEAALLTSAAGAESGFDPTKTHDAAAMASRGLPPGYGLYGHNDTRLAAMRQQFGPNPTAQQQIQFALNELRSRPEGARVNAAKTPEELTELQMLFEVPAPGPTDQRARRLATTREYMLNPPKAGGPPAGGIGGGVVDKTADAGFGQKFGPLEAPQGMVIHHTAGGGSVDDVIATFKKTNFPAQFVIDRDGQIYQTLPDGYRGQHVRDSWGPLGAGKGNSNLEGVEIIANNNGDVLPVQQQAAARLVAMRAQKYGYDPRTSVYGHGELNPGHKEADEGMSTVTRIRNGSLSTTPSAGAAAAAGAASGTSSPPAVATAAPVPGATTPAAAAAPPTRSAGEAPAGTTEVWGDSLGVGLNARLKTEGTTVGGASPTAILANIKAKPDDYWKGKTVVLASGSNRTEMDKVEETINYLQDQKRGATVMAVGYGPKFPEKNAKLREIAKRLNIRVIDAEDVAAGEGVHPSREGYALMAGTILRARRSPPSAAAGMKEPANVELPPLP
jgi:hypothetical protein